MEAELLALLLSIYGRCRLDRPTSSTLHRREYFFCCL